MSIANITFENLYAGAIPPGHIKLSIFGGETAEEALTRKLFKEIVGKLKDHFKIMLADFSFSRYGQNVAFNFTYLELDELFRGGPLEGFVKNQTYYPNYRYGRLTNSYCELTAENTHKFLFIITNFDRLQQARQEGNLLGRIPPDLFLSDDIKKYSF
jgi:hypothetical protein